VASGSLRAAITFKIAVLRDRRCLSFEVFELYHEIAVRRSGDAGAGNRKRLDRLLSGLA
jgi:hypothetical protein